MQCDLDTADAMAAVHARLLDADGVVLPRPVGPTRLLSMQRHDRRAPGRRGVPGPRGRHPGRLRRGPPPVARRTPTCALPRGHVHPGHRRRGTGTALLEACEDLAREDGRTRVVGGGVHHLPARPSWPGTATAPTASRATPYGGSTCTARRPRPGNGCTTRPRRTRATTSWCGWPARLPTSGSRTWSRCTRRSTTPRPTTPTTSRTSGAPTRVQEYDAAMAARRQTTYRVLARHRPTGAVGRDVAAVRRRVPAVDRLPGGHQRGPRPPRPPARAADEGGHAALGHRRAARGRRHRHLERHRPTTT